MGSEHSSSRAPSFDDSPRQRQNATAFRRQHPLSTTTAGENEFDRPGSTSPGPSVCSDTDLPYISYTVNRPIGDSPKITKPKVRSSTPGGRKPPVRPKTAAHNIVVVKAAAGGPHADKDADTMRLQSIPMFLPIMRATLNLPAARDPEVLERLDVVPLQKLCARYQSHMAACASQVAAEQNAITQRVRDADADVMRMVATSADRHKHVARNADKLRRANELSHQLNKCHRMLNAVLESMDALNALLDIDERLEPFVWTTG